MAPIARIRPADTLEKGQSTGSLSIQRPRPGPPPRSTGQANTVLGRRLVGGLNERQTVELFAAVRLTQSNGGEPGDIDITNGRVEINLDDEDNDYVPSRRYAYSREHKLAAIDYFQTTWRQKLDSTHERLSNRYASRKLKITRKQLRDLLANKEKILCQKKGTFRSNQDCASTIQEPDLEPLLNARFEKAREQGQKISYK